MGSWFVLPLICAALPMQAAQGRANARAVELHIPAGPAGDALRALARATGDQIAFREADVAGVRTAAVRGPLTAAAALARMLEGTGLRLTQRQSGVYVILAPLTRVAASRRRVVPPAQALASPGVAAEPHEVPIVVTGSRIRPVTKDPVGTVFSINVAEVQGGHALRAEDLIASLPLAATEQGAFLSGQASGTATVNLRGLGSARTLVLVNGRRMMPGDPLALAPDLNMVPLSIVERVEILSGGGSSIYGSDAVAGVINFITDDQFEGLSASTSAGVYIHDNDSWAAPIVRRSGYAAPRGLVADGLTQEATVRAGTRLGNAGHIAAYGTWRKAAGVLQSARDYSACALSRTDPSQDDLSCLGSNTTAPGRFILNGGSGPAVTLEQFSDGFRPYSSARDSYNYAPDNHLQRPDTRLAVGLNANYDLSAHLKPFVEILFAHDRTEARIAPSGIFGQIFPIGCNNPLLSLSQAAAICGDDAGTSSQHLVSIGRRNVEGRPRIDHIQHSSVRATFGVRGVLSADWQYDGHVQYGRSSLTERFEGDLSRTRIARALDVTTDLRPGSPTLGKPVCAAVLTGEDAACLPYNIWSQTEPDAAALDYLTASASMRGHTEQWVVQGTLTGRLDQAGIGLPWADEAIGVVIGGEFRRDALLLDFNPVFESGDLSGQSGTRRLDQAGHFEVAEVFSELQVPFVDNDPFGRLTFEFGFRSSHYSTAGWTYSGRAGFSWASQRGVILRGSYNRAVRAPNVSELFAPVRNPTFSGWDPCAGSLVNGLVNGYSLAACAASGVTEAQFGNIAANPARLFNIRTGGNPALRPELADTFTLGLSLLPPHVPRLSLSLDYFNIRVRDAVSQIGANLILTRCVETGVPALCNLVHRSPTNGSLDLGNEGYVEDPLRNIGSLSTSGLDLGLRYGVPLAAPLRGQIRMSLSATHVFTQEAQRAPELGRYDCVGLYGLICGIPTPRWRHRISFGWEAGADERVTITWRRSGGVEVDRTSQNPLLVGAISPNRGRVAAQNYFDLSALVPLHERFTLSLSIRNLFDRAPPLIASDSLIGVLGNGNTFPQLYDPLGRFMQLGVSFRL